MIRRLPTDVQKGSCAVCGSADGRGLLTVALSGGEHAAICGTHDLMHRRAPAPAKTIAELVSMFSNRRGFERRSGPSDDTLADALSQAFVRERRAGARRAG